MEGYFTGILDLYYAKMTTEESTTTAPVYEKATVLASTIEVTITPAYREGKLNASNVTKRTSKRIDTYNVKLSVDKIPHKVLADLLGREKDANGVQIVKGSNQSPSVALGFAFTMDNGSKELWWLYKGEFSEIVKGGKTDGEKLEYQTQAIEGVFVRRMNDDALSAIVDTADSELGTGVVAGWFTNVYESSAKVVA